MPFQISHTYSDTESLVLRDALLLDFPLDDYPVTVTPDPVTPDVVDPVQDTPDEIVDDTAVSPIVDPNLPQIAPVSDLAATRVISHGVLVGGNRPFPLMPWSGRVRVDTTGISIKLDNNGTFNRGGFTLREGFYRNVEMSLSSIQGNFNKNVCLDHVIHTAGTAAIQWFRNDFIPGPLWLNIRLLEENADPANVSLSEWAY